MINADFISLRNFMLDKNRYFNQGFANVYQDELTGLIYHGDGNEKFAVGIDDRFGNYFYLRTDSDIRYTDTRPQMGDTTRGLDETLKCYLVAVVEDAIPKELVQALLNSLLHYGDERIRPLRAIYIREVAAAKELAKLPKENVAHVLENLGERQVVTLEFDLTTKFSAVAFDCIPNPCKQCNDE